MSDNSELLADYVRDVGEEGDLAALERYLSPSFQRHRSPVLPPLDRTEQIDRLRGIRAAFPDVTIVVQDVVAEADRVAFRSVLRGTHTGEFMGISPTGVAVTVGLLDLLRIKDGKFAEQWGGPDMHDMLGQLGATYSL